MAMWSKTKLPEDYPHAFHAAIMSGPGDFTLVMGTESDCRREANRFNAFKAALRRNPSHATSRKAVKLTIRLRTGHSATGLCRLTVRTSWAVSILDSLAIQVD